MYRNDRSRTKFLVNITSSRSHNRYEESTSQYLSSLSILHCISGAVFSSLLYVQSFCDVTSRILLLGQLKSTRVTIVSTRVEATRISGYIYYLKWKETLTTLYEIADSLRLVTNSSDSLRLVTNSSDSLPTRSDSLRTRLTRSDSLRTRPTHYELA
ncbi:hypothetical protein J6590_019266 [Homalodisca vitripennis]|nr:hypothetical protein J6590_019266 [Homalodisca vitripennis]